MFIALSFTGELGSWNVLTGKLIQNIKVTNIDLSKYDFYEKQYKKGHVFLKSKENIDGYKKEDFFMPW